MPRGQFGRGRPKSQGRSCPSCRRILLPTRNNHWPHHMRTAHGLDWCKKSGQPITATTEASR